MVESRGAGEGRSRPRWRRWAAVALGFAASIEVLSWIAFATGILRDDYAVHGIVSPEHLRNQGLAWRSEVEPWGAWHVPGSSSRHAKTCFDVVYRSNDVGARSSFDFGPGTPEHAIVALGDSFVEGYGLPESSTFTTRLQARLDRPVLNFGSAYAFGPVQYHLVYEGLASRFRHDAVVVAFLPANDFSDNDPASMRLYGRRNRPYYREAGDAGYAIFYPEGSERSPSLGPGDGASWLRSQVVRSAAMRLYGKLRLLSQDSGRSPVAEASQWFSAPLARQKAAVHFLERVISSAIGRGAKDVIVLGIPSAIDFDEARLAGRSPEEPWWVGHLRSLERRWPQYRFVNGFDVDASPSAVARRFLPCDPHWSPEGADEAARLVADALRRGRDPQR